MQYDATTLDRVNDTADILLLFHHRNKNQHRRSIWWRHFSTFRRQTRSLQADLASLVATPPTNAERVAQKKTTPAIKANIEARLTTWPIAQWQRAFTQLVADARFAQLGLVLLAALAEICALTGCTTRLEDLGEVEVQKVLNDFAEDMGVAVDRSNVVISTPPSQAIEARSPRTNPASSRIIKRKVKKNAIDDLFSGL